MATKVVMEALSPTMEEGRLVKWMKNEGDQVKQGDVLAEVETDKAVMELVARGEGVLRKRLANEGDSKPVGELIAVIAGADEDVESLVAGAGAAPAPAAARQEKPAPRTEAKPAAEEKPAAAEPTRTAAEPPSAPWPSSIPEAPEQAQGEASLPSQERERRGDGRWRSPARPAPRGDGAAAARERERVRSSPLARRLASEQGLELEGVQGSGPGGRFVKRDIEAAIFTEPAQMPAGRFTTRSETLFESDCEGLALTHFR